MKTQITRATWKGREEVQGGNMNDNNDYRPDADFVSKTMKQVYAYEASKRSVPTRVVIYNSLQRYVLAFGGALFGILNATRVF